MPPGMDLVVTCARGTDKALRFELERLGAEKPKSTGRGAVELSGSPELVARINVESRIALKVLWVQRRFEASSEEELVAELSQLRFEEQLGPRTTFSVEAHLSRAPWNHTRYAAQRVKDIIVDRLRDKGVTRPDVDTKRPMLRFVLHWEQSQATFSFDTSGESLNRRGYRQRDAVAPMRETLAAAILALGHADVKRPFLDPCCGSGTLAIEQAWRALQRAPGSRRKFACEKWPFAESWRPVCGAAREEARSRELSELPQEVLLSDYHHDAVDVAARQIDAAGLGELLQVHKRDARKVTPPENAVVVANLPFGERLGKQRRLQLEGFYRGLGAMLAKHPGRRVLLFTGMPQAEELLGLGRAQRRYALMSGALEARLLRWDL